VGAEKIRIEHESLKIQDLCPDCQKGKLYENIDPGVIIRVVGQAPLQAKVYELVGLGDTPESEAPESEATEEDVTAGGEEQPGSSGEE